MPVMTTARRRPSGAAVFRPAVTDAIMDAALAELGEQGLARLSMERVSKRAGVGKSAIYRRWSSKVDMIVDLVALLSVPSTPLESTGDLRADVRRLLDVQYDWVTEAHMRSLLPDLLAESQRNEVLAAAVEEHIGIPRRQWAIDSLAVHGIEVAQVSLVMDLVGASVFWQLTHFRPLDEAYLDGLADFLVRGLTTRQP